MGPFLSPGGALAALAVGAAVTLGTGWRGLVVLLVFFLSSSLLTPGGGRRRAAQVGANGGIAAAAALLAPLDPLCRLAFVGALAAAAADTWSTEIGGRSRRAPRLITTGRPVAAGTSGGVTWLGTAGGAGGAGLVAAAAAALGMVPAASAVPAALAGIVAGAVDSVLGATIQARYRCPACGGAGESARHGCGAEARLVGGWRWMTNDTVNLVATVVGAATAALPAVIGVVFPPSP
jgi:uncharacterized protein (TIGR00297 family)